MWLAGRVSFHRLAFHSEALTWRSRRVGGRGGKLKWLLRDDY